MAKVIDKPGGGGYLAALSGMPGKAGTG